MTTKETIPFSPYLPFDPTMSHFDAGQYRMGLAYPIEFTDWRDEIAAWKQGVAIHAGLNPTISYAVIGPGALQFLKDNCVNGFQKFSVGGAKHAIMCNDAGEIMIHGMLLRTGEEEFLTQWLSPWVNYLAERDAEKYDITLEDRTFADFLFQLSGAKTLEVLQVATGEDLEHIGFLRHHRASVAGHSVRIVRIGMSGALAYEVHGEVDAAHEVYNALMEAGRASQIRRLGLRAYMLSHTEGGFPQFGYHFLSGGKNDQEFIDYSIRTGMMLPEEASILEVNGSAEPDPLLHSRHPFELGWGHVVKFDHEFRGRKALEKFAAAPTRATVTLEWNKDDILDIHRSQLEDGEPYLPMDLPNQVVGIWPGSKGSAWSYWADKVLDVDDKVIGVSTGRSYSWMFREVISLATIDIAQAKLGNEVTVVWGHRGSRQKQVRAKVARFPYFAEGRNDSIDVKSKGK